jgi:hypothetical protein
MKKMPISANDRLGKRGVAQRVVEFIGAFQTTPKLVLCWLRYGNRMVACRGGDEAEAFMNIPALYESCKPTKLFQQPKTKEMSAEYSLNQLDLFSYTLELQ